ncbi:MAG TPA: ABC transporter permease, partial [Cyclobacteriaceae bacterium]|nr:ABC transporter permease [Cyclobacteriaceae bacterium]
MLKNYFIIGIRNLLKQKGYSIIKIAGLAFGLASAMIIYLYVQEDLSFDRFHANYKQIVRVLTIDSAEGVSSKVVGVTPPPLGPAAESEIPEIKKSTRLVGSGRLDLTYKDRVLRCNAAFFSESSFFEVFDFKILDGKKEGILDKPNSIVITESLSKRLFGDESPIGKTIKQDQNTSLFISGLIQDPPKNSHIQFDLLRSLTPGDDQDGLKQFLGSWQGISTFTYFLIDGTVNSADLNAKLKAISKKNNAYDFFTPIVQPLSDVHLLSKDILFESNANKSDILNVYVLSTIAILILILAIVNFINLVTAKSTQRAKEVGLRKVIGAVRQQLIGQHLTESIVVTLLSAVLAVSLVISIVSTLNTIYQRFAIPTLLLQGNSIIIIIGLILMVGVLAGLYPAVVLSSFKPAAVLKGDFKSSAGGIKLRKALVVVQFTISIALMAGTAIVYQQMNFIYSKDLGYDRN